MSVNDSFDLISFDEPKFQPMQYFEAAPQYPLVQIELKEPPALNFPGYPKMELNLQTMDPFELKEFEKKDDNNYRETNPSEEREPLKRCSRCGQYYRSIDNCRFHPGKFGANKLSLPHWKCCGETRRDSVGCRVGKHIECLSTTKLMREYSQMVKMAETKKVTENQIHNSTAPLIDFSSSDQLPRPPSDDPLEFLVRRNESKDSDEDLSEDEYDEETSSDDLVSLPRNPRELLFSQNGQEFIRHPVLSTDTLIGLSLKYNVTTGEIQRENGLGNDNELWTRQWIRIPFQGQELPEGPSEAQRAKWKAERRKRLIGLFVRKSGCETRAEAELYLKLHRFRLSSALKHYQDDYQWELYHPPPKSFSQRTASIKIH